MKIEPIRGPEMHVLECAVYCPGIKSSEVNGVDGADHTITRNRRAHIVFALRCAGLLVDHQPGRSGHLYPTPDGVRAVEIGICDMVADRCRDAIRKYRTE